MEHTEYTLKHNLIKRRLKNLSQLDTNNFSKEKLPEFKEFYVDNGIKKTFRYFEASNVNAFGIQKKQIMSIKDVIEANK